MKEIIVVDLYNTLIRNQIRLGPYRRLRQDRAFFNTIMKYNGTLEEYVKENNLELNLNLFHEEIKLELSSIIFNFKLIDELNKQNKDIVLLSNLSKEYAKPIEDLKKYLNISKEILSFEVGYLKPEKEIFKLACSDGNAVMYGDNIELDIKGAIDAGYKDAILVEQWW